MELGIKKISQLGIKSTLNLIGKIILEVDTLLNKIFNLARELNTKTI